MNRPSFKTKAGLWTADRWLPGLFAPLPASGLAAFRLWFGAVMLWEMCRFWQYGWLESDYLSLTFFFTYYGFDWVRPWPEPGMSLQLALMTAAAAGLTLGLFSRLSALAFFLGYTHLFLVEATYYQNHCYLICLLSLLLVFVPANRELAVDAWRAKRRRRSAATIPNDAGPTVPAWTVWLFRFQIGVPYVYGGLAKLELDWLSGAQSRMMLMRSAADWPALADVLTHNLSVWFFTWGGLLLDLLIVPALLWRRTRWPAYALAVLFHLTNATLLEIGIFPWLMIGATLVLFEPDWPRRLFRLRRERSNVSNPAQTPAADAAGAGAKALVGDAASAGAEAGSIRHDRTAPARSQDKSRQGKKRKRTGKSAAGAGAEAGSIRHEGDGASRRSAGRRLTVGLLGLYVAWQVLFPFRLWLYPGNPSWTEDGHRFSWRMKLGFKTAMLPRFFATDPATGATAPVAYEHNLTLRQLELMAGQPDMLLQFSRYLADEMEALGYGRMEIRVLTAVSLNGRKPQLLADPNTDLANQPRTLGPTRWVVPLKEPLRDEPWDWGSEPIGTP